MVEAGRDRDRDPVSVAARRGNRNRAVAGRCRDARHGREPRIGLRCAAIALVTALSLAACATPPGALRATVPAAVPADGNREPRSVPPASTACPTPAYPDGTRRSSVAGLTRVSGEVQPDGSVRSVVVIRSSGTSPLHKQLDRAAADALAQCRFPPAPGTAPASTTVNYRWTAE